MSAESAAPVVDGSFSAAAIIQPYIRPAPVIRPIARMARKRGVFACTRDRQWRMSQAAPKPVIKAQSKPATAPAAVPRSADPRNILPWNPRMIMRNQIWAHAVAVGGPYQHWRTPSMGLPRHIGRWRCRVYDWW